MEKHHFHSFSFESRDANLFIQSRYKHVTRAYCENSFLRDLPTTNDVLVAFAPANNQETVYARNNTTFL